MSQAWIILAQGATQTDWLRNMPLFVGVALIMYFVMIRPQQKQLKAQRDALAALKKGDEVITQAGIIGRVYLITDKVVTLEIANGVRVQFLKSTIQGKVKAGEEEVVPVKAEEKKEER
jgi:preprotein translocase subunit YajC